MKNNISFRLSIAIVFIIRISASAQSPSNFIEFMSQYYQVNHELLNDSSYVKSGADKDYDRQSLIWTPRLYPHGNFSLAAKSMYDYANSYIPNEPLCSPTLYNIHWNNIIEDGTFTSGIGMINKIYFDPNYNGTTNRNIYAASNIGGLWRWNNNIWQNLNTDIQLPFTTVSDIAVNKLNSNMIFISTGLAEGNFTPNLSNPNWSNVNPIFTIGIYRSIDNGITWKSINNGLMTNLQFGGVIRRIIENEVNPDQMFAATTDGLYVTNNATSSIPGNLPQWSKVNSNILLNEPEFKGLEFKPGDPNTVYLSSKDIYRSVNNGLTWTSMTGPTTGLDFSNTAVFPTTFSLQQINITVSISNPNKLYAYIIGSNSVISGQTDAYIYVYDLTGWHQILYCNNIGYNSGGPKVEPTMNIHTSMMAIAVNPLDENQIFFGFTVIRGTINGGTSWYYLNAYTQAGIHADTRALAFEPNTPITPKLFAGTDGGISVNNYNSIPSITNWIAQNDGLNNGLIWAFDISHKDKNIIIEAKQDLGIVMKKIVGGVYQWRTISGGDGYAANLLNETDPEIFYYLNSGGEIATYDPTIPPTTTSFEKYFLPIEPPATTQTINVPKTFHTFIHPISGKKYVGFHEIWERLIPIMNLQTTINDLWKQQSDIYKSGITGGTPNGYEQFERQITEFGIAKSDENKIYVVTGGVDYGNTYGVEPRLFASSTGLNEGNNSLNKFIEITNLPTTTYPNSGTVVPVITGLAISPIEPNTIWLTFTGFDPAVKVYKGVRNTITGIFTWTNEDPTQHLANLPVNAIVYQEGTNDRLYIGTDAGVYYKDNSMSCWDRYGDIPNVRVTELKINPCSNKLVASTYGRSVFETDLLPSDGVSGFIEINANTVWQNDKVVDVNIKVNSGFSLTINSHVFMAAGTKIVVEPGAKLEVNNGQITNSCGAFWQGIVLIGNKSQNQFPVNNPQYQAYVNLVNSEISYAREAISTWDGEDFNTSGGVVKVDNCDFINNRRAITFMQYENKLPNSNSIIRNFSSISNSRFTTNDSYLPSNDFYAFVSMWGVRGIQFTNCTFANFQTNKTYSQTSNLGILSIDAGFSLRAGCSVVVPNGNPCPQASLLKCSFLGLNYAVKSSNSGSNTSVSISDAYYDQNYCAISISGINNVSVVRSEIKTGNYTGTSSPTNYNLGISLDLSTGYKIEENNIHLGLGATNLTHGIVIKNSNDANNIIYKNNISYLTTGFRSVGDNRSNLDPFSGLQFICNNNIGNSNFDFKVTTSINNLHGIRTFQGTFQQPAGNSFSHIGQSESDFSNGSPWPITYYYSNGGGPNTFTPAYVNPQLTTSNNGCPSNSNYFPLNPLPVNTVNQLQSSFNSNKNSYVSLLYNYNQLIDDGNSSNLLNTIVNTWSEDEWTLRSELLSLSPYLSKETIISVAGRGLLPQAMLLEVCLANPDATKNDSFLEYLQTEIPNPFNQEMIDIIKSNWNHSTYRTSLEQSLAYYSGAMSSNCDFLILNNKQDTIKNDSSLVALFESRLSYDDKIQELQMKIENENYGGIEDSIENMRMNYKLSETQNTELDVFQDYISFRQGIHSSGKTIARLNENEISTLTGIAELDMGRPSNLARNILCFFYNQCLEPANEMNLERIRDGKLTKFTTTKNKSEISVYPNPAKTYTSLMWNLANYIGGFTLSITSIDGKVIEEVPITEKSGVYIWKTELVPNGIYLYKITNNSGVNLTGKISVDN